MRRRIGRSIKKRMRQGLVVLEPNVAGVDCGSREHWVCAAAKESGQLSVKGFATMTEQLEALADWLHQQGVVSVAMESTGTYWISLFDLLEERGFEVLLVDARKLKKVPGRKTDILDCQWIQQLHSCGLVEGCFRPPAVIRELRALARERSNLKADSGTVVQRMQKALDQMNVQLHHAVTDLTGVTGMKILRAIVGGERDPQHLARYRDRRCGKSQAQIAQHLKGTWRDEHLFTLESNLERYDHLQTMLEKYEQQIILRLQQLSPPERQDRPVPTHPNARKDKDMRRRGEAPLRTALWRFSGIDLTRIDGLGSAAALRVISEVGFDLTSFPTSKDFVSWLKTCPPLNRSAGKNRKGRAKGFGSSRIAQVLRMGALSLKNSPTALGGSYRRMARRKGSSIAIGATARKLAEHIYRALRWGIQYLDQGAEAYEARFQNNRLKYATKIAKSMGYTLVPLEHPNEVSA